MLWGDGRGATERRMETTELGDFNGGKTFELLGYIQQWIGERRPWRYNERGLYRVMTAALRAETYQAHRLICGQRRSPAQQDASELIG